MRRTLERIVVCLLVSTQLGCYHFIRPQKRHYREYEKPDFSKPYVYFGTIDKPPKTLGRLGVDTGTLPSPADYENGIVLYRTAGRSQTDLRKFNVLLLPPSSERDVDNLLQTAEDLKDYIDLRRQYKHYAQDIKTAYWNYHWVIGDDRVRELASKLEKDPRPVAQRYLAKVKGFSYTVFEVYTYDLSHPKERFDKPHTEISRRVEVNPYTGNRRVLEDNIQIRH